MPVKINGIAITPAPVATFGKAFSQNANGVFGAEYSISLNGDLLAYKGNPYAAGSGVTLSTDSVYTTYSSDDDPITVIADTGLLNTIIKKQEQLRYIFSSGLSTGNSLLLEITGYDADNGIKAYCELESLNFDDESRWTTRCGYSATLKTSRLIQSANGIFSSDSSEDAFTWYISEASEEWSISEAESYTATASNMLDQKKTYTITHNVSAVGKRSYESGVLVSPISQAKGYVTSVIGLGSGNIPDSLLPITSGTMYDNKIVETINNFAGSYSVQESFTLGLAAQPATEEVQISIDNDLGAASKIQIQGTIKGLNLQTYDTAYVDKFTNAAAYWSIIETGIYTRVNNYIGGSCALNTVPLSKSVGKNITEGIITYNYTYDNRPSNLIPGALTEDIQIVDTYPGQYFNVVPVIGRSQPIIQYVNSRSEYKRSLSINAIMPFSGCLAVKPATTDLAVIYELYKPSGTRVYYSAPQEQWNPKQGTYSYTIEWTYEF